MTITYSSEGGFFDCFATDLGIDKVEFDAGCRRKSASGFSVENKIFTILGGRGLTSSRLIARSSVLGDDDKAMFDRGLSEEPTSRLNFLAVPDHLDVAGA